MPQLGAGGTPPSVAWWEGAMPQEWGCPPILPDPPPGPHPALPPGGPILSLGAVGREGAAASRAGGALLWKLPRGHPVPSGACSGKRSRTGATCLLQGLAFGFRKSQGRVTTGLPQVPARPPVPPLMGNLLPLGTGHLRTPSGTPWGTGLSSLAVQPSASHSTFLGLGSRFRE